MMRGLLRRGDVVWKGRRWGVLGRKKRRGWGRRGEGGGVAGLPLLDFVEAGKEWHGDEDDDGLFAVTDFELCGGEKIHKSALIFHRKQSTFALIVVSLSFSASE